MYTDYHKKNTKHYILAKSKTYDNNKYYLPSCKYYQNRQRNYEFDINEEDDYDWISLIVNSICYTTIDYLNISETEKYRKKSEYKHINVKDFRYITGNKDWFVAIDNNFNITGSLLPYDGRAKHDYFEALKKAPEMLNKLMGDEYGRKNL